VPEPHPAGAAEAQDRAALRGVAAGVLRRVLAGMADRGLSGVSLGEALAGGRAYTVPWFLR